MVKSVEPLLKLDNKGDYSRADQATGENFQGGFHAFSLPVALLIAFLAFRHIAAS